MCVCVCVCSVCVVCVCARARTHHKKKTAEVCPLWGCKTGIATGWRRVDIDEILQLFGNAEV